MSKFLLMFNGDNLLLLLLHNCHISVFFFFNSNKYNLSEKNSLIKCFRFVCYYLLSYFI